MKPCPFCGNNGRVHAYPYGGGDYRAWVECDSCTATGPAVSSDKSEEEARLMAVELWERRETKQAPDGAG